MAYSNCLRNSRCYYVECKPPYITLEKQEEKNRRQDPGDAMLEKHWKEGQAKGLRRKEGS